MNELDLEEYNAIRESGAGFIEFPNRGLIEVSGSESEMFLTGLITNDVKTLAENTWMRAAFPNAQGRLLAVVRVWKKDGNFYFETEAKTYETVLKNLERFTLAGDFKVRDLSHEFVCFSIQGKDIPDFKFEISDDGNQILETEFEGEKMVLVNDPDVGEKGFYAFVSEKSAEKFREHLFESGITQVSGSTFETLRIEAGQPIFGVDMDDSTVVPEIGLPDVINYNKGCYIGQEVIARIHFRGHVAKQLTGLVFEDLSEPSAVADGLRGLEIKSSDDKNAGKITSVTFSPKLGKIIALGYVRYAYLEEGTTLEVSEFSATVKSLPFLA